MADFIVQQAVLWEKCGFLVSLVFQSGRAEWKCCEWQRSVSLTQSPHTSPSRRLAQKQSNGTAKDKRKRRTEKCVSFRLLLNHQRKSVWECVWGLLLSYFLTSLVALLSWPAASWVPHTGSSWKLHVCKITKRFLHDLPIWKCSFYIYVCVCEVCCWSAV